MLKERRSLNRNKELTDNKLVQRICAGEKALMEELYNRYSAKVYYKCLQLVKDQMTAQDLAHDVMIKVFTNLGKFEGRSDLSFWIYAITYNFCISFLRKKNRLSIQEPIDNNIVMVDDHEEKLNAKILHDLQLDQLESFLESASPEDKIILSMYYQDNLSIKQMSQVLKLSISAVKMRLMRSRNRLAEMFKSEEDE